MRNGTWQEPRLERATEADAAEIADLYLASRSDALPYIRRVHSDDDVRSWIGDVVRNRGETWLARSGDRIVGFMVLIGHDLDQLYIMPGHYRRGIGHKFLALAKQRSPNRLDLFTFQSNARARAFYEASGFRIADMNDGARNEEKEPDMRYQWTPESN